MADVWPLHDDGQRFETAGASTTTTTLTTITSGTANVKGSYAQLIAATAFDAVGFILQLEEPTGNRNFLIDVAVGASGSEQVILSNFFLSTGAFVSWVHQIYIPLHIPAGSRVAMRHQSQVSTMAMAVAVTLVGSGFGNNEKYGNSESWGTATSDSAGVTITPGQNDAKGSYAEITAGSTRNITAIIISVGAGDFAHAANNTILVDIAVGADGSETVIIPNLHFLGDVSEDAYRPTFIGPIPCSIPAGTRVAARAQDTDTTVEAFDMAIMAFSL